MDHKSSSPEMLKENSILLEAELYASEMIANEVPKERYFHSLAHTQSVALRSYEIGKFYQIPEDQMFLLRMAAWFHDVGYSIGAEDHELHSTEVMRKYLEPILTESQIESIRRIIMATKLSVTPEHLLEKIICDADLYHLGARNYDQWALLLKREVEHYHHITLSDDAWTRENISFFSCHKYFTEYANEHWNPQKEKNLVLMKEKLLLKC